MFLRSVFQPPARCLRKVFIGLQWLGAVQNDEELRFQSFLEVSGNRPFPTTSTFQTSHIPSLVSEAPPCAQQAVLQPEAVHSCCIHAAAIQQPVVKNVSETGSKIVAAPITDMQQISGFLPRPQAALKLPDSQQINAVGKLRSYADIVQNKAPVTKASGTSDKVGQNGSSCRSFHDESRIMDFGQMLDIDGRKVVSFSAEEFNELVTPFWYSLVGKFSHGFPSMKTLRLVLGNLNLKDAFSVSLLEEKHVLIRLSCEEDYTRLWCRQVWHIAGYPMRVFKWTPDFSPQVEAPYAHVWVFFPYFPVHLFDKRSLLIIASSLGKPLRIDSATAALTRASVARVCIELDVTKNLLLEVKIHIGGKTFFQAVEYENIPKYCDFCKHLGHSSDSCLTSKCNSDVQADPVQGSDPAVALTDNSVLVEFPALTQPPGSPLSPVLKPSTISPGDSIFISAKGWVGILPDPTNPPFDQVYITGLKEDIFKSYENFEGIQVRPIDYHSAGELADIASEVDTPVEYYTEGGYDSDLPPTLQKFG